MFSTILYKLNEMSIKPRIIPIRIAKNISIRSPKLKLSTAKGSTKYIVIPANEPIKPIKR